ncbi:PR domain zinc finger protein 5-like isoform X2 [Plodia interpunctella]|uniref:PR domain zinc finger protein 5-like isoform X2 n=1 Tax=Plodia interpunctella TaxID=58824 RepID=UPI003100EAA2
MLKVSESTKKDEKKENYIQSQKDSIRNSLKLILNSNMCVFESLKTKFKCFSCNEAFINIMDLRQHSETHSYCKLLKRLNSLRGASFRNVDISNLKCKLCSSMCTDLNDLQNHLISHDIKFNNYGHFLIPYKLEKDRKCTICVQEFNTFTRLSIHMNSHYTNNVCEICGASFISTQSLRTHLNAVHKEKKCTICSDTFSTVHARAQHMMKVHKTARSKRYCVLCNKSFPYSYMLFEHKVKEHGAKRQTAECTECGKTFLSLYNLRVHIRSVHIRERNYPCSVCETRFFTKTDQKRHERTHLDVRSFSCSYCESRFKSKDSLRRHLRRQHGYMFNSNK